MRKCLVCGKTDSPNLRNVKNAKYCSMRCRNIGMLGEGNQFYGKHHNTEDKKVMSKLKKGKPLSIEHRKSLSISHKANPQTHWTGRKHKESSKILMSQKGKGRVKTKEHKKKIGASQVGKYVKLSTRLKSSTTKKRLFAEGKLISPNKNKIMSESTKNKMSIAKKGVPNYKLRNRVVSISTRIKQSNTRKKLIAEGKIILPKLHLINNRKNSNTTPEQIVKKYLVSRGLVQGKDFYQNYWINDIQNIYRADFLLPQIKTIIECDGEYWHGLDSAWNIIKTGQLNDDQKEKVVLDNIRTIELREQGYVVLRFSEPTIQKRFESIEKQLKLFVNLLTGEYHGSR